MNPLNSFEVNELRQRDLRVEAARARLAAEAKRAGRRRPHVDWLRRIASRRWRAKTHSPQHRLSMR
jgi:hypothetical protein